MQEKQRANKGVARRLLPATLALLLALAAVVVVSLGIGAEAIPIRAQLQIAASHFTGSPIPEDLSIYDIIISQMRLPRVLLAVIVGILLASAGTALQALLLNPLADPYTVGTSSGAALGAAIAFAVPGVASYFHGFGVPATAFVFAIAAMFVVYSLSRFGGRVSIHSFLLSGIVVGSFLWAVLTFVLSRAGAADTTIIHWLLGSFADKPWSYVIMTLPFAVIGLVVLYSMSRDLNVFSLGEETAKHLGIETESLKIAIILTTSFLTAAAVSVSGIIGFVGLMVPHIARKVFGSDHRILLPTAALSGAILMVIADTVARAAGELPVGVVTAIAGAPLFLYLLRSRSAAAG